MTAKEIREFVNNAHPTSGQDHDRNVILAEIAAQLAELNERFDRDMILREARRERARRRGGKR